MTDKDINDIFDDILFTEEHIIEESFQQGLHEGAKQENPEAYHLGYHRGAEIGAELGYYLRIITQLSEQCSENTDKVTRLLELVKSQILSFPEENTEEDFLKELDNIRVNYKKMCALLKIDAKWPEVDKLSF